jgi:hypothetical protein
MLALMLQHLVVLNDVLRICSQVILFCTCSLLMFSRMLEHVWKTCVDVSTGATTSPC